MVWDTLLPSLADEVIHCLSWAGNKYCTVDMDIEVAILLEGMLEDMTEECETFVIVGHYNAIAIRISDRSSDEPRLAVHIIENE